MTIYLTYKTSGIAQTITSNYIIKENLMKEERYFKDLAPSSNTLSCQISKDCPFIEDIISSEEDIECMLYQEGSTTPFFGGYVSNNFSWSVGKNGSSVLKLTIEDFGTRLLKKTCVDKDTLFNDTAQNFVSSLVSDKFSIDVSRLPNTNIVYTITKNSTYESVLKKLVQELGYVYYFDYTGTLRFKKVDINKDNYLYTIDKSTLYSEGNKAVSLSKKIRKYSKVEVEWKSLETKPNACIYRDITGSDSSHPNCNIELAAGATYPDPNGKPSYIQASNLDGSEEVVYFTSPQKDVSFVGNVTVDITQYDPKTLSVLVKNVGSSTAQITKLSCYGHLTIVKAINYTVVGDDDGDCLKVKADFIHDEDSARDYANLLLNYYKYCSNVYTFYSSEDIQVGSVCILKEDVHTGLNVSVVVTEKLFNPQLDYYQYIGNGLSQFDVWESNTIGVVPPPKQEAIDGQSLYTWVVYADDNSGTGISTSSTNKSFIGLSYNQPVITPILDPNLYDFSQLGGKDGESFFTWIKYASDASGSNMSDDSTGKSYIGIASNQLTSVESSNPNDYQWSLFKGENGRTYYTWVKYADTPTSGMSINPTGKAYIGLAYNKTTEEASTVYSDYSWSLIKGEDGNKNYTWIKYSNSSSGSNMSDSPSGMTYIGLAFNKTSATESTNPSDYQWMLFKGSAGDPIISIPVYGLSTSSTTCTATTWTEYVPTWYYGYYIWLKYKMTNEVTGEVSYSATPYYDRATTETYESTAYVSFTSETQTYTQNLRSTGNTTTYIYLTFERYELSSIQNLSVSLSGMTDATLSYVTSTGKERKLKLVVKEKTNTDSFSVVATYKYKGTSYTKTILFTANLISNSTCYLGALTSAPTTTPYGSLIKGDYYLHYSKSGSNVTYTPKIYNGSSWVTLASDDEDYNRKILDMLPDVFADSSVNHITSGQYDFFQTIVAENISAEAIGAMYIQVLAAIYAGNYKQNGEIDENSSKASGFHLSSDGLLQASNAILTGEVSVDHSFVNKGAFKMDRFYPERFF